MFLFFSLFKCRTYIIWDIGGDILIVFYQLPYDGAGYIGIFRRRIEQYRFHIRSNMLVNAGNIQLILIILYASHPAYDGTGLLMACEIHSQSMIDRAVQLLVEYADASGLEETKQYGSNSYTPVEFDVNLERINILLGTDFQEDEVIKVLDDLHLEPVKNNADIHVKIPSYRMDLAIEADIAEEIIRILGYDRLPSTMPKMPSTVGALNRRQQLRRKYRSMLSDLGYNEAVTYSLVSQKEIEDAVMPQKDIVELAAPMSEDQL